MSNTTSSPSIFPPTLPTAKRRNICQSHQIPKSPKRPSEYQNPNPRTTHNGITICPNSQGHIRHTRNAKATQRWEGALFNSQCLLPHGPFPRKRVCPLSSFQTLSALCSLLSSSSRFSQALAFPCPKTHFVNLHLRLRLQRANFSDPERVRNIEALEGFLDYGNSERLVKLTFQLWLKIPAFLSWVSTKLKGFRS